MATTSVVTNLGRSCLVNRAGGSNGSFGAPPFFVNVGTGAGVATNAQTSLYSEVGTARLAATGSRLTTTVTNDTGVWSATYTATGTITLTNAGVFDAATAGNLLAALSFDAVTLQASEQLTLAFQVQFT